MCLELPGLSCPNLFSALLFLLHASYLVENKSLSSMKKNVVPPVINFVPLSLVMICSSEACPMSKSGSQAIRNPGLVMLRWCWTTTEKHLQTKTNACATSQCSVLQTLSTSRHGCLSWPSRLGVLKVWVWCWQFHVPSSPRITQVFQVKENYAILVTEILQI